MNNEDIKNWGAIIDKLESVKESCQGADMGESVTEIDYCIARIESAMRVDSGSFPPYDTAGLFETREAPTKIKHAESAVKEFYNRLAGESVELFAVLTLDGAHQIIDLHVITRGSVNRTMVHPRDVFRAAITDNAVAVIVAHNHPSGNVTPSPEDTDITARLRRAGDSVGIPVLDHIVVSRYDYYSFAEHGGL